VGGQVQKKTLSIKRSTTTPHFPAASLHFKSLIKRGFLSSACF